MTLRQDHLISLDVLRGLTVAGMILVNNPGDWTNAFEALTHANWGGCTAADLVFPSFIFILGAAMPFAFSRRIQQGHGRHELLLRVARRAASLIALGLVLNTMAALPNVESLRIPGVLQRIGLVYLVAGSMVVGLRPVWRAAMIVALLGGHWALLTFVPFAGGAAGLSPSHNLAGFVDLAVFGRHTLLQTGDPEGLLGAIPAVGSALLGALAGEWLLEPQSTARRVAGLSCAGLAATLAGFAWSRVFPMNKALWTGSFALFAGGLATLSLTACYVVIDVYNRRRWAQPFIWLGFNPLAVYLLSEVVADVLDRSWPALAAPDATLRSWLFWEFLRPSASRLTEEWASFGFAILIVALWTAVAGALYRRGIRIQV